MVWTHSKMEQIWKTSKAGCKVHPGKATEGGQFIGFWMFFSKYSFFYLENLFIFLYYPFYVWYIFPDIRLESGYFLDFIEYFLKYSIFSIENLSIFWSHPFYIWNILLDNLQKLGVFEKFIVSDLLSDKESESESDLGVSKS